MMEKFLVISPSGELYWEEIKRIEMLDRLYEIIDCDSVECVTTVLDGISLIIDECGRIKDPPQEHNELASNMYLGWIMGRDDILGPAVLVSIGMVNGEPDWVPLNEEQFARLSLYLGVAIPEVP